MFRAFPTISFYRPDKDRLHWLKQAVIAGIVVGAALYLEATGLPHVVTDDIQNAIWETTAVNTTVVIVARAEQRMPVCGEYFQVRRARIVGAQGHSGHGTFPNVISCMAAGMDVTPLITKEISLDDLPENLKLLQTDRENCKISVKINWRQLV